MPPAPLKEAAVCATHASRSSCDHAAAMSSMCCLAAFSISFTSPSHCASVRRLGRAKHQNVSAGAEGQSTAGERSTPHRTHAGSHLVKLEDAAVEQHVGHLLADHPPTRSVREIVVVIMAHECRRRQALQLSRIACRGRRRNGGLTALGDHPGDVLVECCRALKPGVP